MYIIVTAVSGLGLLATFFIEELTLEIDEVGRQGLDNIYLDTERTNHAHGVILICSIAFIRL
jgi:hypothetical protein